MLLVMYYRFLSMKKHKFLRKVVILVILLFIIFYFISNSGYYEYHVYNDTLRLHERMIEFEDDINNGKVIDGNYLPKNIDYSNRFSDMVYHLSTSGTKLTRKILKAIFKKLSYLVED